MQDRQTNTADGDGADRESLMQLLGGRTSALDASLPPVAFVAGWYFGGESIAVGSAVAVLTGAVLGGWRLHRGARPRAVLVSLLAVMLGAVIALRTGQAADFFLIRVVSNAASALAWLTSIGFRWPLLGVVVGTLLRQGKKWRQDPDLVRSYGLASWVWVGQYAIRLAVFIPLWLIDAVVALGVAQVVLTWPLVAVCVLTSWWVLRRTLPADHPGLRHPRPAVTR
ncbi:DUF3159 domain-containing protein [Saccharopolyspora rectivirgula]|jgi:hypothetical protein|uniref:DUF3159 domain-containing protein n=1 Tax=Saccharopolyspora rectivirgula TaxID=28042 RepID=A0A073AVY5_9PSEU|nr:DUF3159 domain-containing protein [Saccharopolyspora rectivirgula]KEI43217.1 hypothetical protein GU90_17500 [Saccharopolyspora rectivirgula]